MREDKIGCDLILLYPLIRYEEELYIKKHLPIEEKKFKDEIETKKRWF